MWQDWIAYAAVALAMGWVAWKWLVPARLRLRLTGGGRAGGCGGCDGCGGGCH